ncbi:glycogen debranching enzyme N-terminal domain-containing protein [Actinoplanes sp. NBRC 101535]|uniref:glycogen debranching enzyme N-terminal domain-containing protein n=1 Tax=Actinoplanes sp. NBRC 101535 TaxID=3032196 RepID=UPI0024A392DA|nr:glycogen debranching enzyme N-terminal domain-containing protein [Actinoplanes sp. NBRC 101535]GLY06109.1 glycogen debranching protein [Actinoplanes sp. NBRC 101535]
MVPCDHFSFGPQVCGSLDATGGAGREWLVTDGLGGFATGTAGGLRTRRQHTLLTVSDQLALTALDLTVTLASGTRIPLYSHQWASGTVDPCGHHLLESFTLDGGLPRWRWRIGDVVVERELALHHGHPSLAVVHRVVSAPAPVGLSVAVMLDRPAEATPVAGGTVLGGVCRLLGPGWQTAGVAHLSAYTREDAAGADLWLAGSFTRQVAAGDTLEISAWSGLLGQRPPAASVVTAAERERAHRLITTAKSEGYAAQLTIAADRFVVCTPEGPGVLPGYPWDDGSRHEVLPAYEGLFLATGRADEGRELLIAAAAAPDDPLWLVHAVDRHVTRTGDTDLAARLVAPLGRHLRQLLDGSGPVTLDPADGLLRHDPPAGGLLPARVGKPVELNALWVNALAAMADLLTEAGRDDREPRGLHARARTAFLARFPAPEGWLYDVVEGPATTYPLGAGAHHDDPSLRPHQLLAWSLPHAPMRGQPGHRLRGPGEALLTPLGLRTLAPTEYGYQSGHPEQGAVRPWWIGPYADACAATGHPVEGLLTGLRAHLAESGVGSVGEAADGEPPHRATGRPFSALAVAEMLRTERGHG